MDELIAPRSRIAIVVIGRNEGDRLKRCLRSLPQGLPTVYVDSGSNDGSVEFAQSIGVDVVELDMSIPFTAARARNTGWRQLAANNGGLELIQFVDGDCEIDANWLDHAINAITQDEKLAAVFGRRRERFPEATVYNRMCDDEWDTPIGLSEACGGDVLFRLAALQAAGGYSDTLIAGEEPDLCLRLGGMGWRIRRIDAEMTLHDADMTTFGAFWKRSKRSGFAYAEHVWRHGHCAIPSWRRQLYSIVIWAVLIPLAGLLCLVLYAFVGSGVALFTFFICLALYPAQIVRLAAKKAATTSNPRFARYYAILIMIGKIAQGHGIFECWKGHILQRRASIIEYKAP